MLAQTRLGAAHSWNLCARAAQNPEVAAKDAEIANLGEVLHETQARCDALQDELRAMKVAGIKGEFHSCVAAAFAGKRVVRCPPACTLLCGAPLVESAKPVEVLAEILRVRSESARICAHLTSLHLLLERVLIVVDECQVPIDEFTDEIVRLRAAAEGLTSAPAGDSLAASAVGAGASAATAAGHVADMFGVGIAASGAAAATHGHSVFSPAATAATSAADGELLDFSGLHTGHAEVDGSSVSAALAAMRAERLAAADDDLLGVMSAAPATAASVAASAASPVAARASASAAAAALSPLADEPWNDGFLPPVVEARRGSRKSGSTGDAGRRVSRASIQPLISAPTLGVGPFGPGPLGIARTALYSKAASPGSTGVENVVATTGASKVAQRRTSAGVGRSIVYTSGF